MPEEWPQHFELDGISSSGEIFHKCSECPKFGPCSKQLFIITETPPDSYDEP